jgi:PIN domain nuclease of toxin-antitoxin system
VILLDTHVLVFDALARDTLSSGARKAIDEGDAAGDLACCDISLWEIAMLISKRRLQVQEDSMVFVKALIAARTVSVMPISAEVATLSASRDLGPGDPADRLIAATALHYGARLITRDRALAAVPGLMTIW